MSYIITGTDSAGALSLKRDSAAAAIKKAVELMADGCRDVCVADPDGRIHSHAEFDQPHPVSRGGRAPFDRGDPLRAVRPKFLSASATCRISFERPVRAKALR
jgi:hypothetical protein